jgi:hypothetical protein
MINDDDICVTTMLMMMIMQMMKMKNEDGDDDDNEDDDEDDDDGDDDDDDTFAILCYKAGQSSAIFSPQSGKAIKAGHVTAIALDWLHVKVSAARGLQRVKNLPCGVGTVNKRTNQRAANAIHVLHSPGLL